MGVVSCKIREDAGYPAETDRTSLEKGPFQRLCCKNLHQKSLLEKLVSKTSPVKLISINTYVYILDIEDPRPRVPIHEPGAVPS